jgi:hypothetical protein
MAKKDLSRKDFLRLSGLLAAGSSACWLRPEISATPLPRPQKIQDLLQ